MTHSFYTGSGRLSAERSPLYWRCLRFYTGHTQSNHPKKTFPFLQPLASERQPENRLHELQRHGRDRDNEKGDALPEIKVHTAERRGKNIMLSEIKPTMSFFLLCSHYHSDQTTSRCRLIYFHPSHRINGICKSV